MPCAASQPTSKPGRPRLRNHSFEMALAFRSFTKALEGTLLRAHIGSLRESKPSRRFSTSVVNEWKGNVHDPNTAMWKHQSKVPRLPVPALKDTLARYLDALEPLVSPKEFEQSRHYVQEFQESEEGRKLQDLLVQLDKESPTSWLEGFWDTMYLELRDSNLINVNPFLILGADPQRKGQVERAASTVVGMLQTFQKIKQHALEPDMDKEGAYDMQQYLRLFGHARIPKWRRDQIATYPDSRHMIVMSKNQFFAVDVLDASGNVIPEADIQANLSHILKQTASTQNEPPVGVLTAEERNRWAAARAALAADETNRATLDKIDRGLFVLVLEDQVPANIEEASKIALHRDGTNRWYDKFVVVVDPKGQLSSLFEHSPLDGHTMLRLWTETVAYVNKTKPVAASAAKPTATKLQWNLSAADKAAIAQAQKNASDLIGALETSVLVYEKYGKNYITSKKLSPDAYVQMAFQLAYFKLHGKAESTYESANTKKFLSGRTETIRSVTKESVHFTKVWSDKAASKQQKIDALKAATEAHIRRANLAKNGSGVDRHLFALRNLAQQKQQRLPRYNVPSIFQDPNYANYGSNVLSTSNVSSPHFDLFGFGPVVGHGLGIAYNIHNDVLRFNVTSYIGEAKKYTKALEETLDQMKQTLD
eukprot:TRINITY_DN2756_c0_g1_i3.p1 TRINITY_DN2756_c0_g1~~TRINITY_DN2756_c0_g1_i3.p1  ORF type:complete len:650 (-),score=175.26 TRINITY_DN2756_c0_g1_i3:34-1983(-)